MRGTIRKKLIISKKRRSEWESTDPVLANGEVAFETDTFRSKLGNGTLSWKQLGYQTEIERDDGFSIDVLKYNLDDCEECIPCGTCDCPEDEETSTFQVVTHLIDKDGVFPVNRTLAAYWCYSHVFDKILMPTGDGTEQKIMFDLGGHFIQTSQWYNFPLLHLFLYNLIDIPVDCFIDIRFKAFSKKYTEIEVDGIFKNIETEYEYIEDFEFLFEELIFVYSGRYSFMPSYRYDDPTLSDVIKDLMGAIDNTTIPVIPIGDIKGELEVKVGPEYHTLVPIEIIISKSPIVDYQFAFHLFGCAPPNILNDIKVDLEVVYKNFWYEGAYLSNLEVKVYENLPLDNKVYTTKFLGKTYSSMWKIHCNVYLKSSLVKKVYYDVKILRLSYPDYFTDAKVKKEYPFLNAKASYPITKVFNTEYGYTYANLFDDMSTLVNEAEGPDILEDNIGPPSWGINAITDKGMTLLLLEVEVYCPSYQVQITLIDKNFFSVYGGSGSATLSCGSSDPEFNQHHWGLDNLGFRQNPVITTTRVYRFFEDLYDPEPLQMNLSCDVVDARHAYRISFFAKWVDYDSCNLSPLRCASGVFPYAAPYSAVFAYIGSMGVTSDSDGTSSNTFIRFNKDDHFHTLKDWMAMSKKRFTSVSVMIVIEPYEPPPVPTFTSSSGPLDLEIQFGAVLLEPYASYHNNSKYDIDLDYTTRLFDDVRADRMIRVSNIYKNDYRFYLLRFIESIANPETQCIAFYNSAALSLDHSDTPFPLVASTIPATKELVDEYFFGTTLFECPFSELELKTYAPNTEIRVKPNRGGFLFFSITVVLVPVIPKDYQIVFYFHDQNGLFHHDDKLKTLSAVQTPESAGVILQDIYNTAKWIYVAEPKPMPIVYEYDVNGDYVSASYQETFNVDLCLDPTTICHEREDSFRITYTVYKFSDRFHPDKRFGLNPDKSLKVPVLPHSLAPAGQYRALFNMGEPYEGVLNFDDFCIMAKACMDLYGKVPCETSYYEQFNNWSETCTDTGAIDRKWPNSEEVYGELSDVADRQMIQPHFVKKIVHNDSLRTIQTDEIITLYGELQKFTEYGFTFSVNLGDPFLYSVFAIDTEAEYQEMLYNDDAYLPVQILVNIELIKTEHRMAFFVQDNEKIFKLLTIESWQWLCACPLNPCPPRQLRPPQSAHVYIYTIAEDIDPKGKFAVTQTYTTRLEMTLSCDAKHYCTLPSRREWINLIPWFEVSDSLCRVVFRIFPYLRRDMDPFGMTPDLIYRDDARTGLMYDPSIIEYKDDPPGVPIDLIAKAPESLLERTKEFGEVVYEDIETFKIDATPRQSGLLFKAAELDFDAHNVIACYLETYPMPPTLYRIVLFCDTSDSMQAGILGTVEDDNGVWLQMHFYDWQDYINRGDLKHLPFQVSDTKKFVRHLHPGDQLPIFIRCPGEFYASVYTIDYDMVDFEKTTEYHQPGPELFFEIDTDEDFYNYQTREVETRTGTRKHLLARYIEHRDSGHPTDYTLRHAFLTKYKANIIYVVLRRTPPPTPTPPASPSHKPCPSDVTNRPRPSRPVNTPTPTPEMPPPESPSIPLSPPLYTPTPVTPSASPTISDSPTPTRTPTSTPNYSYKYQFVLHHRDMWSLVKDGKTTVKDKATVDIQYITDLNEKPFDPDTLYVSRFITSFDYTSFDWTADPIFIELKEQLGDFRLIFRAWPKEYVSEEDTPFYLLMEDFFNLTGADPNNVEDFAFQYSPFDFLFGTDITNSKFDHAVYDGSYMEYCNDPPEFTVPMKVNTVTLVFIEVMVPGEDMTGVQYALRLKDDLNHFLYYFHYDDTFITMKGKNIEKLENLTWDNPDITEDRFYVSEYEAYPSKDLSDITQRTIRLEWESAYLFAFFTVNVGRQIYDSYEVSPPFTFTLVEQGYKKGPIPFYGNKLKKVFHSPYFPASVEYDDYFVKNHHNIFQAEVIAEIPIWLRETETELYEIIEDDILLMKRIIVKVPFERYLIEEDDDLLMKLLQLPASYYYPNDECYFLMQRIKIAYPFYIIPEDENIILMKRLLLPTTFYLITEPNADLMKRLADPLPLYPIDEQLLLMKKKKATESVFFYEKLELKLMKKKKATESVFFYETVDLRLMELVPEINQLYADGVVDMILMKNLQCFNVDTYEPIDEDYLLMKLYNEPRQLYSSDEFIPTLMKRRRATESIFFYPNETMATMKRNVQPVLFYIPQETYKLMSIVLNNRTLFVDGTEETTTIVKPVHHNSLLVIEEDQQDIMKRFIAPVSFEYSEQEFAEFATLVPLSFRSLYIDEESYLTMKKLSISLDGVADTSEANAYQMSRLGAASTRLVIQDNEGIPTILKLIS